MPALVTFSAHLTLMGLMIIRGMDYATGESPMAARRLGAVEAAAPLWVWGALFTAAAALGLSAMAWRWARGVVSAHILGGALYTALGFGITWDVMHRPDHSDWIISPVILIPAATIIIAGVAAARAGGYAKAALATAIIAVGLGVVSIHLDGLRNSTILLGIAVLHIALAAGTAQKIAQEDEKKNRGGEYDSTLR